MDSHSFVPQSDTYEASPGPESYALFNFYHPDYQPQCPTEDDQYASFIFSERECLGDSAYHHPTTNTPTGSDPSGGYVASSILGLLKHDEFFAHHAATIPPGKMSTYSELMPHVVAHKTTVSLKQDVRVAAKPQPCVSPAQCQGHADLPECSEIDDELDCPGELAADFEVESSDEEGEDHAHSPPPPSPYSSPSPPSSPLPSQSSHSSCCEPPSTSRVVRTGKGKNRYSPIDVKPPPSRKGKSAAKRAASGSDDDEPKKPRKRREAVSLACYFCRKRKIACRQPPPGSPDRSCNQCKTRGMICLYPTESRRGARRTVGTTRDKHEH